MGHVSDSNTREEIRRHVQCILHEQDDGSRSDSLDIEYFARRRWCAAPELYDKLDRGDADCIAKAIRSLGYQRCYVMSLWDDNDVYIVHPEAEALLKYSNKCWPAVYLITSEDLGFAIWSTEGYKVYAGPKAFVEKSLGQSIKAARDEFVNMYAEYGEDDEDHQYYKKIADILAPYQEEPK